MPKRKSQSDLIKKGCVYEIDGRKGRLVVRFLEDVDYAKDNFYEAEIVAGVANFLSRSNRLAQAINGLGTPGTKLSFRTTLNRLVRRREDLEVKPKKGATA